MTMTVGRAYLAQAQTDFTSDAWLKAAGQPCSQWLHFLQRALEKTGKAYLAASGSELPQLRQSHLAMGRFLRILARNTMIWQQWPLAPRQFQQHVGRLLPLVDAIERLTPALSTGPNVEYPWQLPDGRLVAPCQYGFHEVLTDLETVNGRNLLKIVERALHNPSWQTAFGM